MSKINSRDELPHGSYMNDPPGSTCLVCGGDRTGSLLTIEHVPVSCAQLFPDSESAQAASDCRLELTICYSCTHIWNAAHTDAPEEIYNDDYYSSFTKSAQARSYQEGLAGELDQLIGLAGKTVLEIGCGDGFFLHSLGVLGAKAVGYEPSSTFSLASAYSDVQVFKEQFQFDGIEETRFRADVIVMRHVLEHMTSPREIVESLRKKLFQGAAANFLLLEVPNSFKLLEDNLFFDFYNDHVHYFSEFSLQRLLRSAGWSPLGGIQSGGEFVRILCKKVGYPDSNVSDRVYDSPPEENRRFFTSAKSFSQSFQAWKDRLVSIVEDEKGKGGRLAIWGVGARGVSLLSGMELPHGYFSYVVDSDPSKHGRFLPFAKEPVYSPEQLQRDRVDSVLVTSYTYFDEILAQLDRFRLGGGKVIKPYPLPEIVAL